MTERAVVNIGNESSDNTIIQNSHLTQNIICSSSKILNVLAQAKQYSTIQEIYSNFMKDFSSIHPLNKYFGVKEIEAGNIKRLVSDPITEDALKKYPKTVKTKFTLDRSLYPGMIDDEPIWEYAYRTQRHIIVNTKEYKEYLGDIEDPFPVIEFKGKMIMEIIPPKFQEPFKAELKSGIYTAPIKLHRIPLDQYGKIKLESIDDKDSIFHISILFNQFELKSQLNINKQLNLSLDEKIGQEKFIKSIKDNHILAITVNSQPLVIIDDFTEKVMNQDIFIDCELFLNLFENLKLIEAYYKCKFDITLKNLDENDWFLSELLVKSIKQEWCAKKINKVDSISLSYDRIHPEELDKEMKNANNLVIEVHEYKMSLLGLEFLAEKLVRIYGNAKLKNINSINKAIASKKNSIKLNFIPEKDDFIIKYEKIEGVKFISSRMCN